MGECDKRDEWTNGRVDGEGGGNGERTLNDDERLMGQVRQAGDEGDEWRGGTMSVDGEGDDVNELIYFITSDCYHQQLRAGEMRAQQLARAGRAGNMMDGR